MSLTSCSFSAFTMASTQTRQGVIWPLICFITCISFTHSVVLHQPPIIEILDGSTFTLSVEYCTFTTLDDSDRIIVSLNTKCFCIDTAINHHSIKLRSNLSSISTPSSSVTKAVNTTNKELLCGIPGPTPYVRSGISDIGKAGAIPFGFGRGSATRFNVIRAVGDGSEVDCLAIAERDPVTVLFLRNGIC